MQAGSDDPLLLARMASLEVRIADSQPEIRAAQKLRYDVFYKEMHAKASAAMAAEERDFDDFDQVCEHMLVVDTAHDNAVVGTYRLLQRHHAQKAGSFYSSGEYDIKPMIQSHGPDFQFLELGRSCVLKSYRTGNTMQLLWRGIMIYLLRNKIDLMFGCASLPGTDPEELALPLSYLHHFHPSPQGERVRALPHRYVPMNLMPKEAIDETEALKALPPLVKGYVRTGAMIGDGAVIDEQFGTTDVFIYFPFSAIHPRWLSHFRRKGITSDGE